MIEVKDIRIGNVFKSSPFDGEILCVVIDIVKEGFHDGYTELKLLNLETSSITIT